MILMFLCGTLNIVIACIEFVVFLPRGHWTNAFVDAIIDLGLSLALVLMALIIYKKNRWGWMGAIGLLGFLILNQAAIATAIWSHSANFVWFMLATAWIIMQGIFLFYLPFSKKIRYEISSGYLLQPSHHARGE